VKKKLATVRKTKSAPLYKRIREILESARASASRSVNTTHVVANWLVGREIVEEEQKGRRRADYGKRLLESLAERLCEDYGPGYSLRSLQLIRQFYIEYPSLISTKEIPHAVRAEFPISDAVRRKSGGKAPQPILYAAGREAWKPGRQELFVEEEGE
jgi:hypothetical protein